MREAFEWNQKINSQHMYGVDSGIGTDTQKWKRKSTEKNTIQENVN